MAKKYRPDIDEYFLKIAKVVGQRATCLRHNVGAVLVQDRQIVATGYNGAPAGMPDCLSLGCLRDQKKIKSGTMHEVCRAVHAEQNAIIQAALHGTSTEGATLYITHSPCVLCAKMIINAKIKRVVCYRYYPDDTWEELFKKAGIKLEIHDDPELEVGEKGESVLVIERKDFENVSKFEGIKTDNLDEFYDGILTKVKYEQRVDAEKDLTLKQIIPLYVISYKDEFFVSKRLERGDEPRLRDRFLLPFGGHINPIDSAESDGDVIERAAQRELFEELDCDIESRTLVGFVNDENMEVSRYHLGFIYLVELKNMNCKVKETEKYQGFWIKKEDLKKYFEEADSWSKYIYKDLLSKTKETGKV